MSAAGRTTIESEENDFTGFEAALAAGHLLGGSPFIKGYGAPGDVFETNIGGVGFQGFGQHHVSNLAAQVTQRLTLPPLRHAIHDGRVLITGKAQADEPFAVEQPGGLFEQGHAAAVVFDEGVVRRE